MSAYLLPRWSRWCNLSRAHRHVSAWKCPMMQECAGVARLERAGSAPCVISTANPQSRKNKISCCQKYVCPWNHKQTRPASRDIYPVCQTPQRTAMYNIKFVKQIAIAARSKGELGYSKSQLQTRKCAAPLCYELSNADLLPVTRKNIFFYTLTHKAFPPLLPRLTLVVNIRATTHGMQ